MTRPRSDDRRLVRLLAIAGAIASLLGAATAGAHAVGSFHGGGGGGGHAVAGGHGGYAGGHAGAAPHVAYGGAPRGYAGAPHGAGPYVGHSAPRATHGYAAPAAHAAYGSSYGGGHAAYYGGAGHGAAYHGYPGGHGGYYGGHGYYAPYHGHGYYYYPGWNYCWYGGGWYWWGGVYPLGLYFATLPLYYSTFWWGGVPYYYSNYTFYRYDDAAGQYQVVAPPDEATGGAGPGTPAPDEPYVYPSQGQTPEQQRDDRYQCYRWAADQTGFDPTKPGGGVGGTDAASAAGAYRRAESACLQGRGYSVR